MTTEAGPVSSVTGKRTWLLLALGGVVFGVVIWSALGGPGLDKGPKLEPPRIPGPNGYDDVLEAGRAIEKTGTSVPRLDLAKLDEAALAPLVQVNRGAIARAREGLDRPFQVPVVYDVNHMVHVLVERRELHPGRPLFAV